MCVITMCLQGTYLLIVIKIFNLTVNFDVKKKEYLSCRHEYINESHENTGFKFHCQLKMVGIYSRAH